MTELSPGMNQSAPSCPICKSRDTPPLYDVAGYSLRRCRDCATDFVHPALSAAQMSAFYDREDWFEGGEKGGYDSYDIQTDPAPGWLVDMLDTMSHSGRTLRILDVGSAYGTHLAVAQTKGWECFGMEPSLHARTICKERHPGVHVVETLDDVPGGAFDLILLLDVIEHLADPYETFFKLFGIGAIDPSTRVAMTTPNARSASALRGGAEWAYCHPPSHLVLYSGASFDALLRTLRFVDIAIKGQYSIADMGNETLPRGEPEDPNVELVGFEGLLVTASGSDFAEFMHERYVPGTYNEITEYEHLPRYEVALAHCAGKRVLDFGCGTGYGAARLADVAAEVVGADLSQGALSFARQTHCRPNLKFERSADLGAGFAAASFDTIVCFEVIEHLAKDDQDRLLQNFSRLLKPSGTAIISTPNPKITSLYDPNPYHIHEMDAEEFNRCVLQFFAHVALVEQRINAAITFSGRGEYGGEAALRALRKAADCDTEAAAYIAFASHEPLQSIPPSVFVDRTRDLVAQTVRAIRMRGALTHSAYRVEKLEHRAAESSAAGSPNPVRLEQSEEKSRQEKAGTDAARLAYFELARAAGPATTLIAGGHFDVDHYAARAGLPVDDEAFCAQHYLLLGEKQGLAPSGVFDPQYYLAENADVREAEMNALLHYTLYGRFEKRLPQASEPVEAEAPVATSNASSTTTEVAPQRVEELSVALHVKPDQPDEADRPDDEPASPSGIA